MLRWILAAAVAGCCVFITSASHAQAGGITSGPDVELEINALLGKQEIALDDLLRLAELKNPELEAARNLVGAMEGRTRQAGAYPNPHLELEVEEMSTQDTGTRKDKLALVQPLVLSRKRGAAVAAARAEWDAAIHDVAQTRREVYLQLHGVWAEQLYLRKALVAIDDLLAIARRTLEIAETRFDARAAPETHVTKALLEVYDLEVTRQHLSSEQLRIVAELKALLGGIELPIERLTGKLEANDLPRDLEIASDDISQHPAVQSAAMDIQRAAATARQARAERLPDLDLFVAYGRARPDDEGFVEAGVSIPLPLFDRKQGRISESNALVAEARNRASMTRGALEISLASARARLVATHDELTTASANIRPAAERGLTQAQEAYRVGRLAFLELIDAQRTLSQVRLRVLQLRKDLVLAQAELMSLLGTGPYGERGE